MHPSVAQAVMEEEGGTAFGQQTLKRAILQASVSQGENQEIPRVGLRLAVFLKGDHPVIYGDYLTNFHHYRIAMVNVHLVFESIEIFGKLWKSSSILAVPLASGR